MSIMNIDNIHTVVNCERIEGMKGAMLPRYMQNVNTMRVQKYCWGEYDDSIYGDFDEISYNGWNICTPLKKFSYQHPAYGRFRFIKPKVALLLNTAHFKYERFSRVWR